MVIFSAAVCYGHSALNTVKRPLQRSKLPGRNFRAVATPHLSRLFLLIFSVAQDLRKTSRPVLWIATRRKKMENAITTALSKQLILSRALDVAANNIANQTTAGFKAERSDFREYISTIATNEGDRDVSLVIDPDTFTDFSAGGLDATNAPLDFAIDGDGYFGLETQTGRQYTRDGNFQLNSFGELTNRNGDLVIDDNGGPILINPDLGPLLVSNDGELQQDGTPIARIGVFVFDDNRSLRRVGDNNFASNDTPEAKQSGRIHQGFIETSNVEPIRAMTDMIEILRAYEAAGQVIATSSDLAREAVQRLTRTT